MTSCRALTAKLEMILSSTTDNVNESPERRAVTQSFSLNGGPIIGKILHPDPPSEVMRIDLAESILLISFSFESRTPASPASPEVKNRASGVTPITKDANPFEGALVPEYVTTNDSEAITADDIANSATQICAGTIKVFIRNLRVCAPASSQRIQFSIEFIKPSSRKIVFHQSSYIANGGLALISASMENTSVARSDVTGPSGMRASSWYFDLAEREGQPRLAHRVPIVSEVHRAGREP